MSIQKKIFFLICINCLFFDQNCFSSFFFDSKTSTEHLTRNIFELNSKFSKKFHLSEEKISWTTSLWSWSQGGLLRRYYDKILEYDLRNAKGNTLALLENHLFSKYPLERQLSSERNRQLLSPLEKYDLLVGNIDLKNSKRQSYWREITSHRQWRPFHYFIPSWKGHCDSVAHAGTIFPPAHKSVSLSLPHWPYKITFYPYDIQALGLYVVDNFSKSTSIDQIGSVKNCPTSLQKCAASPGSFHLSLYWYLNFLNKSFFFDRTIKNQVWNFTLYGYDFSFFNIKNKKTFSTLRENIVSIETLSSWEKNNRHPKTRYIIGVKNKLTFNDFSGPSLMPQIAHFERSQKKSYYYDLELDEEYNILPKAGQWYSLSDYKNFQNNNLVMASTIENFIGKIWKHKEGIIPSQLTKYSFPDFQVDNNILQKVKGPYKTKEDFILISTLFFLSTAPKYHRRFLK